MAAGTVIEIPYAPRREFVPLHERRKRWAIAVTHRRAGKTVACVNDLVQWAITCPLPNPRFAYITPLLNQGKDNAWTYLLDYTACFGAARRVSATELWVELPPNRSRVRIYGADNPNRLRGLYFDGVVFDEYGDMDPQVWTSVVRPLLTDREGWATFIGTPKGRNAFHRLWEAARDDADWFRLELKASDTRLIGPKELADARKGMSDDEYAQEFECSFDAAVRGAYWGKEMQEAEAAGRICDVPCDPNLPVHTAWDLGIADSTVIWFIQELPGPGGEVRVIDVLKGEGEGLKWYVEQLQARRYVWGNHYLPHDARNREFGSGRTRVEMLETWGIRPTICANLPVEDGIQAVRALLHRCWFDRTRCAAGIDALKLYRRKFDESRQEFELRPRHDWTSHYADAFRYFAVEHRPQRPTGPTYGSTRRPPRNTSWVV